MTIPRPILIRYRQNLFWVIPNHLFHFLQVLELQNTLDDLTNRVDAVKEENLKLRSENSVLGQYIENLMQASAVFQSVSPKTGRKSGSAGASSGASSGPPGSNLGSVIRCTARAVKGAAANTPSTSSSKWFFKSRLFIRHNPARAKAGIRNSQKVKAQFSYMKALSKLLPFWNCLYCINLVCFELIQNCFETINDSSY